MGSHQVCAVGWLPPPCLTDPGVIGGFAGVSGGSGDIGSELLVLQLFNVPCSNRLVRGPPGGPNGPFYRSVTLRVLEGTRVHLVTFVNSLELN